jgi:hypothetical protein
MGINRVGEAKTQKIKQDFTGMSSRWECFAKYGCLIGILPVIKNKQVLSRDTKG